MFAIWVNAKYKASVAKAFDKWHHFVKTDSDSHTLKMQKLQLEVGMQRVQSEREVVKEAEQTTVQLRSSLLCTFFFYKWRSCVNQASAYEERKRHIEERKLIKREIQSLREAVNASNKQDSAVLRTATAGGNQIVKSLFALEQNLKSAVRAHQHYQSQHINTATTSSSNHINISNSDH